MPILHSRDHTDNPNQAQPAATPLHEMQEEVLDRGTLPPTPLPQPTHEQQAIIDFAKNDKRSMLINALAGSAKTTASY